MSLNYLKSVLKLDGYGIASHDFPGQQDGDLPFWKGDKIKLLEQLDADWLKGECNGRQGIFPASFVEIQTGITNLLQIQFQFPIYQLMEVTCIHSWCRITN